MAKRFTVGALIVRAMARAAAAAGIDITDVLEAHGTSLDRIQDPDARLPHELALALWQEMPRRTGDDAFGLHLAQQIPRGAYEVLDHAMRHAATLGDGYRAFLRYQRLAHDAAAFGMEVEGPVARLVHVWRGPQVLPRHLNEFVLASLLFRGRMILGEAWDPLEVRFPHPAPANTREHQRLFRAPIHFGRPISELVFERQLLDRALPVADAALTVVLDRYAQLLLGQLPAQESFLDQVRRHVLKSLSAGVPEVESLARQLGMSKRSFFRRLQEQGTSYQRIVDEIRRDLTLHHLCEGRLSLSEIAFLLGYSEVSTFHRAFRRWTGQSPAEYRRGLAGNSSPPVE
jgi:AraC-like DNA-binding protein